MTEDTTPTLTDDASVDEPVTDPVGDDDRPLVEGDLVLLVDNKKRRYLVTLEAGAEFQTHAGVIPHEDLIGRPEGVESATTRGQRFTAYRPTLSDYILSMPRGAQVIYPKDIGPILMLADIEPGCRVFESGVGSGALSMGMLRAGATITGYELREDFASRAQKNVATFLGDEALTRYDVQLRDSYEGIEHRGFDRAVLDLPEPWRVVPHLASAMRPGAILVSYSPSIVQVSRTRDALDLAGFAEASTIEVLNRSWHVDGSAVRPDHRMVAHTGFLTRARCSAP
ncbi:MAG: tRNA (adenine-N1)-methyltransferase [Actinomycetota bacterium]